MTFLDMSSEELTFKTLNRDQISDELLAQCASLFSEHYGVWASTAPVNLRGNRVKLNTNRLRQQCLWNENCSLTIATLPSGVLVGHLFFTKFRYLDGVGSWITQLVVHSNHRGLGIAFKLCAVAWEPRFAACGLITSHPYAVKALERTTGRCIPTTIATHAAALVEASGVPYVQGKHIRLGIEESIIETNFHVDHTEVDAIAAGLSDWRLGKLNVGDEFFAFTFKGQ